MQYTISLLATLGLAAAQATSTFNGICNAAAIARGDCTATAAIVPTSTVSTFNGFCNAAAIARGDCTATAAIVPTASMGTEFVTYCPGPTSFTYGPSTYVVPSATTLTIKCPGGCYGPSATAPATTKAVYTGAAGPIVTAGAHVAAAAVGLMAAVMI